MVVGVGSSSANMEKDFPKKKLEITVGAQRANRAVFVVLHIPVKDARQDPTVTQQNRARDANQT